VAFASSSAKSVSDDTNNFTDDFVRDRQLATTIRVSLGADGAQANADCSDPRISGDGRYVVFISSATNLVAGDTNDVTDVFVRDLVAGTTARVSVGPNAEQGERDSTEVAILDNRLYFAFTSNARAFTSGATWIGSNIFLHQRNDCAPPGFRVYPNSLAVRPGLPAFLEVVVTANPSPTLQWRKDGQPISGATQWVLVMAHGTAALEGQYDVVAINALDSTVITAATLMLVILGDANCVDGVNASDINAYVLALINPSAYGQAYPACSTLNADLNGDVLADGLDVAPFVRLLVSP